MDDYSIKVGKEYTINGRSVTLLTIADLAKLTGIPPRRIRKWERLGIMPKAYVTLPMFSPVAGDCDRRLYTVSQAEVFDAWLARARPGKGVQLKEPVIKLLHDKWNEVTEKFKEELAGG